MWTGGWGVVVHSILIVASGYHLPPHSDAWWHKYVSTACTEIGVVLSLLASHCLLLSSQLVGLPLAATNVLLPECACFRTHVAASCAVLQGPVSALVNPTSEQRSQQLHAAHETEI
jgi:hypothetical protein